MKTIALLLLLSTTTTTTFCQSIFEATTGPETKDIAMKIAALPGGFETAPTIDSTRSGARNYKFKNGKRELAVGFWKLYRGGNHNMGIADTTSYQMSLVTGEFLDLFKFWKTYFQTDADQSKVEKDKHGKVVQKVSRSGKKLTFTFNQYDNMWMIECKEL
jgi:hypothetical protein